MFKNTKEFFEEIANTNRLENRNNYLVFSEYELSFYQRLIEFLDKFEDNTQDQFINKELWGFNNMLDIVEHIEINYNSGTKNERSKNEFVNELFSNTKESKPSNEKVFNTVIDTLFKDKTKNEYRPIEETKTSIQKIILFLNQKKINQFNKDEIITLKKDLNKYQNKTPLELTTNPKHENIFCNNGFELFNHILKEYVKPTKGRQSDLIYYYWKMYDNEPQYIHQRPTEFFNWFENNYDEVFGQLKTLSQVETPQRNKDFSNVLNWFKQQPQQVP